MYRQYTYNYMQQTRFVIIYYYIVYKLLRYVSDMYVFKLTIKITITHIYTVTHTPTPPPHPTTPVRLTVRYTNGPRGLGDIGRQRDVTVPARLQSHLLGEHLVGGGGRGRGEGHRDREGYTSER